MKLYNIKFFLAALIVVMLAACSSHKNTATSRAWQKFTAKYNTYFNGHQAYIDAEEEKEKGNKDNFTELIPFYSVANKNSRDLGKANYDRAIEKSEKTIKMHSIKAKPEWKKSRRKTDKDKAWLARKEYNPFLWKAWLLLGKSQFEKGAFDEAAATFSYMSRLYQGQPAINGLAKAWLAKSYCQLDWLYDADDVLRKMGRDSIHHRALADWQQATADYLLRSGEYDKALPVLRQCAKREGRRVQKARLWYLTGQVEALLDHRQAAYKAYKKVVRLNPPYELEFNARIAQTEVMAAVGAKKMISRLKRMARSDNNAEYLDQVYYAMGNIHLLQRDTLRAIAAYEKGNEKSTRNGIEKGVLLLRLGGLYWEKEKFSDAQRCYGTAIGLLDRDRKDYEELSRRSKVLDELVPHTEAVHLQDSLQELARMPEKDRLAAIDRVIEQLKKKEKEERDAAQIAAVEKAAQSQGAQGNINQKNNPAQQQAQAKDGSWYFYNPMTVNQGKQTFQKQWGKRENADDWQRNNKTVVNLGGTDDEAAADSTANADTAEEEASDEKQSEETDTLANDPHHREYYLAQIPFTDEQVEASNVIIKDGLFHSGIIFKDKLDNLSLSERTLRRLTGQYPDYDKNDEAWYHLFLLYSRKGDHLMADSCLAHMKGSWPDSQWTTLLADPYYEENARFGAHIEDSLYAATYEAFRFDRHNEIMANAKISAERFPAGDHRPKFIFINALSLLNNGQVDSCLAGLKQVVEKYPKSEVTEMAGMIVKGVQEGRPLYGGTFDLNTFWDRRDLTLKADSATTDTLSADRDVPFMFLLVYQRDSINENRLLYEMAKYNFSNFLVRNFDIAIEQGERVSQMVVGGFQSYDEAMQYARGLYAAEAMKPLLSGTRSIVVSEHNRALIGTRYSYADYDDYYQRTFAPLPISNEELLQQPEAVEQEQEEEAPATENDTEEEEEAPATDDDFGDDFW